MKKLLLFMLAAVMVFSLAACGTANTGSNNEPSAPPEGWAKEFTVYIGGSDDWTPFEGKSGVSFTNSDSKVLEISDNGSKVEFTGLIAGDSVITATLDGTESKALVHVRAVEVKVGEDLLKWHMPKTLYIKYEELFPDQINETDYAGIGENYYSGDEYEMIYPDNRSGEVRTWIQYGSPGSYAAYYYNEDEEAYGWDMGGSGYGGGGPNDIVGHSELSEWWSDDYNPGGDVFHPLNAFAYTLFTSGYGTVSGKIPVGEFRQNGKHETICGIVCDIFVVNGLTFWVDPATHYTLKVQSADGSEIVVLEYDANYSGGVPYAPGEELKLP